MPEQCMPWIPMLVAIVSVIAMLCGNYKIQRKMLATHNKEKAIDLLIATLNALEGLYIEYWKNHKDDALCSTKIKIKQTLLVALLDFTDKKYKGINANELNLQAQKFIIQATGGEFDSKKRNSPNLNQCIKISKLINQCIVSMMSNKI